MSDPQLRYKIGISLISGLGPVTTRTIVQKLGNVEALFREKKQNLLKINGVGGFLAQNIVNPKVLETADQEIEFISKNSIRPYFLLDETYPYRLRQCPDAPLMLYAKGDVDLNAKKMVAIVGTRKASQYGIGNCEKLVEDLASHKGEMVIVSGLAYGIDVIAHKAALANDIPTVAVLGHGLDTLYPAMHKKVAEQMIEKGALLSDFRSGSRLDPMNFVRRNRIVAGLSDAVVVVESAEKGGSLLTADMAQSYNRDVFSFPGRVNDTYSKGCHYLIKTNRASLIENSGDLEFLMGWDKKTGATAVQQKLFSDLSNTEQEIVSLLQEYGELPIDMISMKTKVPGNKVSSLLLSLEFSGYVKSLPGKVYGLA